MLKQYISTYMYFGYFGRVSIISFNFTLFASFNEKDIEEYNKVKSFVHFDILLQSDRYSGIFVEVQINRKLIRYHRDNFMTTTTIVDIFVFILLILSSGTYFYSVCLTIKLCKVVHSRTLACIHVHVHSNVRKCYSN